MCNRVWSLCSHHLGLSNLLWSTNVNYALSKPLAHYRPKDDNTDSKSGNLNYQLTFDVEREEVGNPVLSGLALEAPFPGGTLLMSSGSLREDMR
jgi:hypothetical protein